ncbi:MAG TPA: endolytic transglycosylase MltG [Candidatus Saccharimonadales bacterium]|jgi:UPF0755 protein|nr:endolytic transglycosylase MltG [Candidatus Saccharimonadales bacterium]
MPSKKHYVHSEYTKNKLKLLYIIIVVIILALLIGVLGLRTDYNNNIKSLSSNSNPVEVTIAPGSSLPQIASTLKKADIIKSVWAFEWYVRNDGYASQYIEAGTYDFRQSQDVASIVLELTNGAQASNLVTILPGQRIDQIETSLIRDGFSKSSVVSALQISNYANKYSMLQYAPSDATLEGFLYPDSFSRVSSTTVSTVVNESLAEMQSKLTPSIVAGFAKNGLNVYQGITIASIVEQEVSQTSIKPTVAQVFISRYKLGMPLGSDVTAYYGSIEAGLSPSLSYNSPYNTLINVGLPPGPISNVSESSLQAVANPSNTDYLYFVSGDNGTTYFSTTLAEHDAQTAQYCTKLCGN